MVDAKPWSMEEGRITEYKIENKLWMEKPVENGVVVKLNYFKKWLDENHKVGDVFSLDDFYKAYPRHRKDRGCRIRLDDMIGDMVVTNKLQQFDKDRFKVLKL